MEKNIFLDSALNYLHRGLSVIPVKPDKKPFIKWEEFQRRRPTAEEVREWWGKFPAAMIGIPTGTVSGVSVIDIDEDEGREEISRFVPDSLLMPTVKTPSGGQHLYFRTPSPPIANNARIIPGCDFRGEGGYVVSPPSVNSAGRAYEWEPGLSIEDVEPPALPASYIQAVKNAFNKDINNSLYKGITRRLHKHYRMYQSITMHYKRRKKSCSGHNSPPERSRNY